jgi:predicted nucleic acid-binding protein
MPSAPVFVDTSALYALLDRSDDRHLDAAGAFRGLRETGAVTHNYVVVESIALVQARLGLEAVRRLLDDLLPVVSVRWVGVDLHRIAAAALLASGTAAVSFVDRVSFAFMREHALTQAFAYDGHFAREGFTAFA